MKKTLLAAVLAFSLACAGALEAMAPEAPFELPAESTITQVNLDNTDGVSTTILGYSVGSMGAEDLQKHIQEKLTAEGWSVNSVITSGAPGIIAAEKGGETLGFTVEPEGDGSKFVMTWTR